MIQAFFILGIHKKESKKSIQSDLWYVLSEKKSCGNSNKAQYRSDGMKLVLSKYIDNLSEIIRKINVGLIKNEIKLRDSWNC